MKKVLGLDLGTNSIGWALVEINHEKQIVKIIGLGSRIIPMNTAEISNFENKGTIKSAASQRTEKRGTRRLNERFVLRRDRLHLILDLLNVLPEHYKIEIDFEKNGKKSGKFKKNKEPKIAYVQQKDNPKKYDFLFKESYNEMLNDFDVNHKVPYDWTLYYLRKKAIDGGKLSLNEFAWVLLSYNQKRGYEKTEIINKSINENELIEEFDLKVKKVSEKKQDKNGKSYYEIQLEGCDNFIYKEYVEEQMTFADDLKEVTKKTIQDKEWNEKEIFFTITDIYSLTIKNVEYKKEDGKHKFTIKYNNGWKEIKNPKNYTFKYKDIKGKKYDYIVETTYFKNGEIKLEKKKERKLREPDFSDNSSDWTLLKKRTEKEALEYNSKNNYVDTETDKVKNLISPKIYETLKKDARNGTQTKIIGGMFQVVDRKFYREELNTIIRNQKNYYSKLEDQQLIKKCINLLYQNNNNHRQMLENKKSIEYLLTEDILLYQRPLKSKKSEIGNCKYERRIRVDKETGEIINKPIKVISASHPLFQEFRIWDKIHNLKLIQIEIKINDNIETNIDVTKQYFKTPKDYQDLFEYFNNRKTVNQKQFLEYCRKKFKINKKNVKWNFPEDEKLKGNETRISFITRFKRRNFDYKDFLTQEKEIALWHYLYSINYKERTAENNKSLRNFFAKYFGDLKIPKETIEKLVDDFESYPKIDSKYCAYSAKALKKLLPFLRTKKNSFKGQFDISQYETDLKAIEYDKKNIPQYIEKLNLTGKEKEEQKQNIHFALWQYSINKRIKKILNKLGKINFNEDEVDYSEVVTNESTDNDLAFPKGLFNTFKKFKTVEDFTNLDLTKASYLVYGRHSELAEAKYWKSPNQIREELHQELKHNSLNNPIAEKILLEMMQVIAEIWETFGEKENDTDYKKLFDEIHIEVGRELKKTAKAKEKIFNNQKENRKQNKRLRQILQEFLSKKKYKANPQNPDHFNRLKIAEEGASIRKNVDKDFFKDKTYTKKEIEEILKKETITKQDFDKYKLWIEQGYKSPYTNQIIKLSDLFDGNKYNIDHIFPQALISNDSLSNKVVCETEVNKDKSSLTGRAFIMATNKKEIYCQAHKSKIKIVDDDTYVKTVKNQFSGNKKEILLSKTIPSKFINSQLNTSQYIARKAMELLSHIVREKGEVEYRSKNVLPVTGIITNKLKETWKLNQVWKQLVAPRFIRMNELTQSSLFGSEQIAKNGEKYFDCNIDNTIKEKMDGYNIKRIDHRHHALDALIIALCTKEHINYLNNIASKTKLNNIGKQKQLEKYRLTLKRKIKFSEPDKKDPKEKNWHFMLPGEKRKDNADNSTRNTVVEMKYQYKQDTSFNKDYKKTILTALQNTLVTFKQNKRVINKTVNTYSKWDKEKNKVISAIQEPNLIKNISKSKNKYNWAIRRSLGEETFYEKVFLGETENKQLYKIIDKLFKRQDIIINEELKNEISELKKEFSTFEEFKNNVKNKYSNKKIELKVEKIVVRKELDKTFSLEKIKTITDTSIQEILKKHLRQFDTIKLPFEQTMQFYDALLEKDEFEAIVKDEENDFNNIDEFIDYLKINKFKFNKTDYSKLNVFIEKVTSENLRDKADGKNIKITERPEIAFTSEAIDKMNEPENLKKLNNNKNHAPIKKVRISKGFGKQRALSEDKESVKSKQYVVNDAGSNLYLGVYEREYINKNGEKISERKFQDIGLIELIEILKQDSSKRLNPLPDKIYDKEGNKYYWKFTLSPLDLVYVPTENEIENPNLFNINNLTYEQMQRIYKLVKYSGNTVDFIHYPIASVIFDVDKKKEVNQIFFKELEKKSNNMFKLQSPKDKKMTYILNEIGKTSRQNKTQNTIDEKTQIKKVCWKLEINRTGKIINIIS